MSEQTKHTFKNDLRVYRSVEQESVCQIAVYEDQTEEEFLEDIENSAIVLPDLTAIHMDEDEVDTYIYRVDGEGNRTPIGEVEVVSSNEVEVDMSYEFIEGEESESDDEDVEED